MNQFLLMLRSDPKYSSFLSKPPCVNLCSMLSYKDFFHLIPYFQ